MALTASIANLSVYRWLSPKEMEFFLTLVVGESRFARTAGSTKIPLKVVDAERKKRKVPCDVVFRRPLARRENEERDTDDSKNYSRGFEFSPATLS